LNHYVKINNPGKRLADWLESPLLKYEMMDVLKIKYETPTPTSTPWVTPPGSLLEN